MCRDFAAFRFSGESFRRLLTREVAILGRENLRRPPRKRTMFHVSERMFHGKMRQRGGGNLPAIDDGTAAGVMRRMAGAWRAAARHASDSYFRHVRGVVGED
jgi:hypothetical protein